METNQKRTNQMIKEQLTVENPIIIATQYDNGSYFSEEWDSIPSLDEIKSFRGICSDTRWENVETGRNIILRGDEFFIIRNNWQWEEPVEPEKAYNHLIK